MYNNNQLRLGKYKRESECGKSRGFMGSLQNNRHFPVYKTDTPFYFFLIALKRILDRLCKF